MASRELSDWLTAYLKYTDNTEPPKSYHIWTGISILAGALQRKVYCRWGFETIYCNMYIVLIGPSGRCRKGTAMTLGHDILKEVGIPLTAESITREALIRAMDNAVTNFTDPTDNTIKFHCSLTTFSEELSVFLGQNDIRFLADLTNWYDSRDSWKYETKNKGTDKIQGVCYNLLGGTAPDWLQSILPQEAVGGGFTSRIIFVVEEQKKQTIIEPIMTQEEINLRGILIKDLSRISTMAGCFTFTKEAKKLYGDWYALQDKLAAKGIYPIEDPRFSGYCDRRATHIKKLAMILSASRSHEREIDLSDMERAKSILEAAEVNMHKTFGGLGKSKYSDAVEMVLDYLIIRKEIKRSELLTMFRRDLDPPTLKVVEEVLTQMKVMKLTIVPGVEDERIYTYCGPKATRTL